MRRTAIPVLALAAILVGTARALLTDGYGPDQDEIDLAAVAAVRRITMRAKTFIGATLLVALARVELDLGRVSPAPTGVEVAILMFGGSLRIVTPPGWRVTTAVRTRGARVAAPPAIFDDDAPVLWLKGSAWVSTIAITRSASSPAVAVTA